MSEREKKVDEQRERERISINGLELILEKAT